MATYKWKSIVTLAGVLVFGAIQAAPPSSVRSATATNPACTQTGMAVETNLLLTQTTKTSSVLVALLSGNTADASRQLGNDLASLVLSLNAIASNAPCGVKVNAKKDIYPVFRVVAAVNHVTPIVALQNNKAAMAALDAAIAANPTHYKTLLDRAKHWQHGI